MSKSKQASNQQLDSKLYHKLDNQITKFMPECFLFEKVLGTIGFGLSSNSDVVIRVKCKGGNIQTKIVNWQYDPELLCEELTNDEGYERWITR